MHRLPVLHTLRSFIALLCLSCVTAGCWNRLEIETLGFVSAAGLDNAVEAGKVQVTVQLVKPFALSGGEKGVTLEKPFWTVSGTGYTTFDAVRNLRSQSPRRPFWAHNRWILIGEDLARNGISGVIDFLERDGETRRRAHVAIGKGVRASDILYEAEFELARLPAEGGRGVVFDASEGLSTIVTTDMHDLLQALEGEGIDPVLMRVEMIPRQEPRDTKGELLREDIVYSARITGAAVLRGDKLVGWLDKPETRGLNWVTGKAMGGILVIEQPGDESMYVGLEVMRAGGGARAQMKEGKLSIKVSVQAQANIGDVQGQMDFAKEPVAMESMERRMATVIQNEIKMALAKARELKADIFGFGREIRRSYPKEWKKLKDTWVDEGFQTIDVELDVRAIIMRGGLSTRSIKIAQ